MLDWLATNALDIVIAGAVSMGAFYAMRNFVVNRRRAYSDEPGLAVVTHMTDAGFVAHVSLLENDRRRWHITAARVLKPRRARLAIPCFEQDEAGQLIASSAGPLCKSLDFSPGVEVTDLVIDAPDASEVLIEFSAALRSHPKIITSLTISVNATV